MARYTNEQLAIFLNEKLKNLFAQLEKEKQDREQFYKEIDKKAERIVNHELQVDTKAQERIETSIRELNDELTTSIDEKIDRIEKIRKKNVLRLPYWILAIVIAILFFSIGTTFYAWSKAEAYDMQKSRAKYFEKKYNEMVDKNK